MGGKEEGREVAREGRREEEMRKARREERRTVQDGLQALHNTTARPCMFSEYNNPVPGAVHGCSEHLCIPLPAVEH